jgi:transcriptional regulator with XRE-family HTH domain
VERGEGQAQVAKAGGVPVSAISEMERGKYSKVPRVRAVIRIARHLKIEPLRLLQLARPDFKDWAKAFGWSGERGE